MLIAGESFSEIFFWVGLEFGEEFFFVFFRVAVREDRDDW